MPGEIKFRAYAIHSESAPESGLAAGELGRAAGTSRRRPLPTSAGRSGSAAKGSSRTRIPRWRSDAVVIASRRDPELVEPPPDARNRPGSFPSARYHQYRYALAIRLGLTGRSDGLAEVPASRRLRRGDVHRKMVQAAASRCNINATPKSSISSFGCRRRWWRHIRGSSCVDIDHLCSYHHQSIAA